MKSRTRPSLPLLPPPSGASDVISHTSGGNRNACQPGTFPTGNWQADGGTAPPVRPPPAFPGRKPSISQDACVPDLTSAQLRPASTAASPAGLPPNMSSRIPSRRSDTATLESAASPPAPPLPIAKFHGAMPATGTCVSGVAQPPARARDILAKGACVSGTAPLSLGTGSRASSTVPPQPCAAQ